MEPSPHSILVTVCELYDSTEEPVSLQQVATAADTSVPHVRPALKGLYQTEFLIRSGDGYRPTVTAREFLELDVELADVAVLDFVEG